MPSVEMRRSTRVFVPKGKGGELVKVLRSGRRLWVDSSTEINHQRSVKNDDEDEWFPLINDHTSYKPSPPPPLFPKQLHQKQHDDVKGCRDVGVESDPMDVDEERPAEEPEITVKSETRVIKNVYSRKRKRSSGVSNSVRETRKFGLHFVRRQRRKSVERSVVKERECGKQQLLEEDQDGVLSIVIESSCAGCSLVSRLLWVVLRHIGTGRVGWGRLSTFLASSSSSPVTNVFASFGIHFLLNLQPTKTRGVCRIFGERQRIPMLIVHFSALPLYFLGWHAALSLRSVRASWLCLIHFDDENGSAYDDDEPLACTDFQSKEIQSIPVVPDRDVRRKKIVVAGLEASKVGSRIVQHKSGVLARISLKRRSRSLRNRRARNPSNFIMQKATGIPVLNHAGFKKNGVQSPLLRDLELRRSARKNPAIEMNGSKSSSSCSVMNVRKSSSSSVANLPKSRPSSMINVQKSSSDSVDLNVDIDSQQCCSVNVLVVETDKCYRIEGAEVALDLSPSNEWVLAVRRDGMTRYRFKVQKELRPNMTNRFTHAVIWTVENGWKLEFPDKKNWVIFKELYKVCGERNVVPTSPVAKIIPVPGVSEVADSWDSTSVFERPEAYIRMASDELSRVLSRRTASYDIDSEDEEWLNKYNIEVDGGNLLSTQTFELMIDAFEKASYCSPEDVSDEKASVSICLDLASPDVTVHAYRYWSKKRKQKHAPLLRVFELNEPKRASLITKPVLRKKRSLKRTTAIQPFQRGRGKDSSVLQALAVEQTILEEQHAVLKVQEARVTADKSVEVAIQKRQRAQFLMENADLAVYRATMALRIADAATQSVGSQEAAGHFLD